MHNYLILYQIPSILPIVKALVIQELAIQEMAYYFKIPSKYIHNIINILYTKEAPSKGCLLLVFSR